MAYDKNKAKKVQLTQSNRIEGSFLKNVDATPNKKFEGIVAKNVSIKQIYPSPNKWNFYDKLSDDKKLELMESIEENGLLSPIIVWEVPFVKVEHEYTEEDFCMYDFKGATYMCLAGHNRIDAYMKLFETTKDIKYENIPTLIFHEEELNLTDAQSIVIDTNYVQRVLTTKETVKSIMYKYIEISNNKTRKGKVRDIVAADLGLSPTMVYNYMKLSTVIEPFQNMVYENKLNLTSVLKLVDKSQDLQQWIYDTYSNSITSKALNKIKPYMKKSDIQSLLEKELAPKIPTKKIYVEVPEDMVDDFKEMAYQWIYNKTKRD